MDSLTAILKYTEVWALIMPILIWGIKKSTSKILFPIKIYLCISFILNIVIDMANFKIYKNNNSLYNIESLFRLYVFIWFFYSVGFPASKKKLFSLTISIFVIVLINFFFWKSFTEFSSVVFSIEAIVLIVYCIFYFLKKLKEDYVSYNFDPILLIITGLAIYEAVCFPVFLFYDTLVAETKDYAVSIWDVHNIAYIVFCLFIARAFYGNTRNTIK